jgi:hypothetical protein
MKQPNVSPDLRILKEEGVLEIVDASGRQDFWARKTIDPCEFQSISASCKSETRRTSECRNEEEKEIARANRKQNDLLDPNLSRRLLQSPWAGRSRPVRCLPRQTL